MLFSVSEHKKFFQTFVPFQEIKHFLKICFLRKLKVNLKNNAYEEKWIMDILDIYFVLQPHHFLNVTQFSRKLIPFFITNEIEFMLNLAKCLICNSCQKSHFCQQLNCYTHANFSVFNVGRYFVEHFY